MTQRFAGPFPIAALFDGLPSGFLQRLALYGHVVRFAPGEVLVEDGQPNEWLHIITAGRVNIECMDPVTGQLTRLDELGPGDIVGECGILDKDAPICTARAITDVETYRLHHPAIAWTLMAVPEAIPPFTAALRLWIDAAAGRKLLLTDHQTSDLLRADAVVQPAVIDVVDGRIAPDLAG